MDKPETSEGAIKNEQTRDTGNCWHSGQRQAKRKNTTQETKKMSNRTPPKTESEPM